ncbi:MAG: hypothetical protein RLZZ297_357, partial [Chloroflexota bacterium]
MVYIITIFSSVNETVPFGRNYQTVNPKISMRGRRMVTQSPVFNCSTPIKAANEGAVACVRTP